MDNNPYVSNTVNVVINPHKVSTEVVASSGISPEDANREAATHECQVDIETAMKIGLMLVNEDYHFL
jgi:hypothetical protein